MATKPSRAHPPSPGHGFWALAHDLARLLPWVVLWLALWLLIAEALVALELSVLDPLGVWLAVGLTLLIWWPTRHLHTPH